MSYTRIQLEDWLKTIEVVKGRVLDIGGSQLSVLKRLKNTALFVDEYKILDLPEPHECKTKPDIICDLNSFCLTIENPAHREPAISLQEIMKYQEYFDVAFCLEVSEYWYNPYQAMKNIAYLMKPNGVLYISFHFIYPAHNPVEQDYLRYTPAGVEKLLKETGFEILDMQPRKMKDLSHLYGWWCSEGMRPSREDYNKHDWAGCLVEAKKI